MAIRYHASSSISKGQTNKSTVFQFCFQNQMLVEEGSMMFGGEAGKAGLLAFLAACPVAGVAANDICTATINELEIWINGLDASDSIYESDLKVRLTEGVRRIHELMLQRSAIAEDNVKHQVSVAAAWFTNDRVVYTQTGNCRIYRLAEGVLTQLSEDHTEAWDLVLAGKISPEKSKNYPGKHVFTQILGGTGKQVPKLQTDTLKIETADAILLCNAGFSESLTDREIEETLLEAKDPEGLIPPEVTQQLIKRAFSTPDQAESTVLFCQSVPSQSSWTRLISNLE
jgi:PPM family protein phosphatase